MLIPAPSFSFNMIIQLTSYSFANSQDQRLITANYLALKIQTYLHF